MFVAAAATGGVPTKMHHAGSIIPCLPTFPNFPNFPKNPKNPKNPGFPGFLRISQLSTEN